MASRSDPGGAALGKAMDGRSDAKGGLSCRRLADTVVARALCGILGSPQSEVRRRRRVTHGRPPARQEFAEAPTAEISLLGRTRRELRADPD